MKIKLVLILLLIIVSEASKGNRPVTTIIVGLWDIKRGELAGGGKRSFEYYLNHFKKLLLTEVNIIIFGDRKMKEFVNKNRNRTNTVFIERELGWFQKHWHNELIENVRKRYSQTLPNWKDIHPGNPQFGLYLYNTVVMTKLFLMNEALAYDEWNSDYFIWEDGGINHSYFNTQTLQVVVSPTNLATQMGYMIQWHSNFNANFFYQGVYSLNITALWAWANYFTLYIEVVKDMKNTYENMLRIHLEEYDMTTDEGIFTEMFNKFPYLFPMITGLRPIYINKRFEVNSYYSYKIQTHRKFVFDEQFERTSKLLFHERKEHQQNLDDFKSNSFFDELSACQQQVKNWLLIHKQQTQMFRLIKYIIFLTLLIFLYRKVRIQILQIRNGIKILYE